VKSESTIEIYGFFVAIISSVSLSPCMLKIYELYLFEMKSKTGGWGQKYVELILLK